MRRLIFTTASLVLVASAASAQDSPQEPAKAEKKVCQTEKMTGSLTRVRRICLTRAEWDDLRLRTKHSFDEKVSGASGGCMAASDPTTSAGMCGR